MKTNIPENITYLVKKTGCTQDEFGAIFGLNKSAISFYALNKGLPKFETVIKICAHFDISIDDFVYKSLENEIVEAENDLLKKFSQLVASLEEEVEQLNLQIIKLRSQKSNSA